MNFLKDLFSSHKLLSNFKFNNKELIKRFAGHSKWQNIRHVKAEKDAEKNQIFTKLARYMKAAVQEGGSTDPEKNLKLSQLIEQAKRSRMPLQTLQSILKSFQNDKTKLENHLLDIKGPGGCFILCEVLTGHIFHFRTNILAPILKKHNAKFGDGSGRHLFEEKGIIEAEMNNHKTQTDLLEMATEHAIESGAEDVQLITEDCLQFFSGKTNLSQVASNLEKLGYNITSASVEYIPLKLQSLKDSEIELVQHFYQKVENMSEVIRLADNIA